MNEKKKDKGKKERKNKRKGGLHQSPNST